MTAMEVADLIGRYRKLRIEATKAANGIYSEVLDALEEFSELKRNVDSMRPS